MMSPGVPYLALGALLLCGCAICSSPETRAGGIEFNVSDIPLSVDPEKSEQQFDPVFMTALYQAGYDRILAREIWRHEPPGLSMTDATSPTPGKDPAPHLP